MPLKDCFARIIYSGGSVVEAQVKDLLPDMSSDSKWLELSFVAPEHGEAEVELIPGNETGKPLASDDGMLLDNGLVRVKLNKSSSLPPIEIFWNDCSGILIPEVTVDGIEKTEANEPRRIKITRNGAIRSQIELFGKFESSLNYRMTLELWKDNPALQIDWMLSHEIPGESDLEVEFASLTGKWDLGGDYKRVFHQSQYTAEHLPRSVTNPNPVIICADEESCAPHVAEYEMLLDDSEYPFYCVDSIGTTEPWLQLHGNSGALCAVVQDFNETMPNALASSKEMLNYQFVPPGKTLSWPQGRRKEQTLMLSFSIDSQDPYDLKHIALKSFYPGKALPAPETIGTNFDCDLLPSLTQHSNIRFNLLLDNLCRINTPAGKWNLGDTPDAHYTRGYAATLNQYRIANKNPLPKMFKAGGGLYPDEGVIFLEPVWTNNEYDFIHVVASEIMRTGKQQHFDMLRWTARHNIEVDFVVYSDELRHHQASPFHSHFHNRKGAITSHFWTQGLLEYYCLSGDDDALETALALGRKILEINHSGICANWKFDREIGWALLALVSLIDAGFTQFEKEADDIVEFLLSYDRKAFSGKINLSAGCAGRSMERQIIDCSFGYASMIEALDRYQRMTERQDLAKWLDELLFELKDAVWEKIEDVELPFARRMSGLIMAIGFERTGDEDFLIAGEMILQYYLEPAFEESAGNENGELKACAMTYRGLARLFKALDLTERSAKFELPALLAHRRRLHGGH